MKTPFFLLFLCIPFLAFAQCDDSVRAISGSMGYKARGQHCEGFYRSLVSANDLTIGARPDTQKSVKPTIIEHLARSGHAGLIWNWVLGIVGLLSAVIGLLPKKKS